jgi:guanine deaminase
VSTLIRATVFHTPESPFAGEGLKHLEDGAVVFDKTILAVGDYATLAPQYPEAKQLDMRGSFLLPGLVDTHVHFPQIPVIGAMGLRLLEWLQTRTLPAEEQLADLSYAREQARVFLRQLLRNGTTTALVFGAHHPGAMTVFFEEAAASGLRIASGLVLGDRHLSEALHTTPERAYQESLALAQRWHNVGRLRYAITPRFALSCSDDMLAVCQRLMAALPDALLTTHINESPAEISTVLKLFAGARDYLETYERHQLVTERSVFAHNVHVYDRELEVLAQQRASIAHCPSSNMFIGSGLFDMRRHLRFGVRFALGSDVGGGTGFSILKEGLMAYQGQMLHEDGVLLSAAHLLYLATQAGAEALQLGREIGSLEVGKAADLLLLTPPENSTLAATLKYSPSAEAALASIFTLAREDCVARVYVAGEQLL